MIAQIKRKFAEAMANHGSADLTTNGRRDDTGTLPRSDLRSRRFVAQLAHGKILIEIRDGFAHVNGDDLEPIAETLLSHPLVKHLKPRLE